MGNTKRYCIDCGSRLVYYANLSNPKAPNELRLLTYACPKCTKNFEKPTLISIQRNAVDDPLRTVKIFITESKQK